MTNCEFTNAYLIDEQENELIPLSENVNDLKRDSTIIWKNLECPEDAEAGYSRIIEKDGHQVFYRESITTGDFLVASVGLFIIIILFIDLMERRLLPRFVRFWK